MPLPTEFVWVLEAKSLTSGFFYNEAKFIFLAFLWIATNIFLVEFLLTLLKHYLVPSTALFLSNHSQIVESYILQGVLSSRESYIRSPWFYAQHSFDFVYQNTIKIVEKKCANVLNVYI